MSKLLLAVLALVALFATVAYAAKTQSELRADFGVFVTKFNKQYATAEEFESRFQIYVANAQRAEQLTAESKTATFTANNQFGDWSKAERDAYLGRIPSQRKAHVKSVSQQVPSFAKAKSFDLAAKGVTPPVMNQGQCGSCWAFSTTEGVMSSAKVAGYASAFDLSVQQLVSCDKYDGGCNGGDLPTAFQALQDMGGYMTATEYPYTSGNGKTGTCNFVKSKVEVPVKGFEWVIPTCEYSDCTKVDTEKFLANVEAKGVAPSICVYVSDDWFSYDSGVFDHACSAGYYDLNHCVLFTAYDSEEGSITLQNSWGTTWGMGGFMKISTKDAKNPNLCGWADEATFAIV